jgi:hypothetical protein
LTTIAAIAGISALWHVCVYSPIQSVFEQAAQQKAER